MAGMLWNGAVRHIFHAVLPLAGVVLPEAHALQTHNLAGKLAAHTVCNAMHPQASVSLSAKMGGSFGIHKFPLFFWAKSFKAQNPLFIHIFIIFITGVSVWGKS